MAVREHSLARVADLLPAIKFHTHLAQLVSPFSVFKLLVLVVHALNRRLVLLALSVVCHAVLREEVLAHLRLDRLVPLRLALGGTCSLRRCVFGGGRQYLLTLAQFKFGLLFLLFWRVDSCSPDLVRLLPLKAVFLFRDL